MDEFDKLISDLQCGKKKSINKQDFDSILNEFNSDGGSITDFVEAIIAPPKKRGRKKKEESTENKDA